MGMEIGMGMRTGPKNGYGEMEHEAKAKGRAWGEGRVAGSDIWTVPTSTRAKEDERPK